MALLLVLYGAIRGIARLALGWLGLALGWFLAVRYCEPLALRLGAAGTASPAGPDLVRLVAFVGIFLGVAFLMSLLAWLVARALGAVRLGGLDRLAGAGLGLLMAVMLLCAATVPLLAMWPPDGGPLIRDSALAPYAVAGGEYLKLLAPEPVRSRFSAISRAVWEALGPPAPPSARSLPPPERRR